MSGRELTSAYANLPETVRSAVRITKHEARMILTELPIKQVQHAKQVLSNILSILLYTSWKFCTHISKMQNKGYKLTQ